MIDEMYIKRLEAQVDDLEELLQVHETSLGKALVYARDRNDEIKKLAEFFYSTMPTQTRLRKSLAFWNDNDINSEAKFQAVPWKAITEAVDQLPDEKTLKDVQKTWGQILASYTEFEKLQKVLKSMNKKLRGRSKELVDSLYNDVKMKSDIKYHFNKSEGED